MRHLFLGTLLVLSFGLLTSVARSQATLDTNTKVQIVTLVVNEAEKAMAEGKRDTARFYLLGVTEVASKLRGQLPQDVATKFNAVAAAAWPNMQENITDFEKTVKEFTPKLNKYGSMMNFMTPHDNMGFDEWARYVIGARDIAKEADACGCAYAAKAPHPLVLLSPAAANMGAYALFPSLFNMLVGESFANEYAKIDILPKSLQKAEEVLKAVSPTEKSPSALMSAAGQVETYAGYALAIEKENAQAKGYLEQAKALVKKAEVLYAAQVAANRLPADSYKGEGGADLRTQMQALYAKAYPKEKVLKVVITSGNWVEFAEAWSERDSIKAGIFRSIDTVVAVQHDNGHYWVHGVRFRRQWTGIGDTFGEMFISGGISPNYEMLKENVK